MLLKVQILFSNLLKIYNLRPTIARIFPLWGIGQAHRLMEDNEAIGKVVICIDNENKSK